MFTLSVFFMYFFLTTEVNAGKIDSVLCTYVGEFGPLRFIYIRHLTMPGFGICASWRYFVLVIFTRVCPVDLICQFYTWGLCAHLFGDAYFIKEVCRTIYGHASGGALLSMQKQRKLSCENRILCA